MAGFLILRAVRIKCHVLRAKEDWLDMVVMSFMTTERPMAQRQTAEELLVTYLEDREERAGVGGEAYQH